jgi:L-threonylcarbamoyladenylate synthase
MTKTRTLRLEPGRPPDPILVRDIAAALRSGAVAAYPTETFYALGAAAFDPRAVARIFRLKRRDADKPLSFVLSDLDMVGEVAAALPPSFKALAGEFWPGPLTLILPAAAGLPDGLLGPGRTIAVRIPPPAWLRAVIRELAEPLTATSANLSGGPELADPAEVAARFDGKVDLIVDGGPAPGGRPSTIVDIAGPTPRILREGAIPAARIAAVLRV